MRILSPTCQLKSSVESDIVSIKRQVRDLETKVDDILNLLRKPKSGEGMFTRFVAYANKKKHVNRASIQGGGACMLFYFSNYFIKE